MRWAMIALAALAVGLWAQVYMIETYTLDRTTTPQTVAYVESCYCYLYADDGVTKLDSGYTDAWGVWITDTTASGASYQRVYCTKDGYADVWVRYYVANATSADTYAVPVRMWANPGVSTYTLTVNVIEPDGSPASGVTVRVRVYSVPENYTGSTTNWLMVPDNVDNYAEMSTTTNSGGVAEFDVPQGALVKVVVGSYYQTPVFEMDSNKSLKSLVYSP